MHVSEESARTIAIAFLACVPATIAAWGSLRATLNNGQKAEKILENTNGRLTEVMAELKQAHLKIAFLQSHLQKKKRPPETHRN